MEKNENDGGGVNNPKAELISSSQMNFERFRLSIAAITVSTSTEESSQNSTSSKLVEPDEEFYMLMSSVITGETESQTICSYCDENNFNTIWSSL